MALTFYDCSRPVAADRWHVEIRAELVAPLAEELWQGVAEEDQALLGAVRERMGRAAELHLVRERNFVDGAGREAIVADLMGQLEENLGRYLVDPSFPRRLFVRRYEELREQCLLARRAAPVNDEEDDDGPADFSHCFRD